MAKGDEEDRISADKDAFEEADEKGETEESYEEGVATGERDEDIYDEHGEAQLEEDDEISPAEAAFMKGAHGGGQDAKCRQCGKILKDDEDLVEAELDEETIRFCSNACAEKYLVKHG